MRILALAPSLLVLAACSSSPTDDLVGTGGASSTGATTSATGSTSTGATGSSSTGATGSTSSGAMGDTWANFAQTAFSTYCVECHNPNDPLRDYDKLGDVMKDAPLIRCGVASTMQSGCGATPVPKQFPINDAAGTNPKPSDVTRARIVAWIDAGMP